MLFLNFFIDRLTGDTKRCQNPPSQGASVKLNCHLILRVAAKIRLNCAVNAVPLSGKTIRRQPLRGTNFYLQMLLPKHQVLNLT